MRNSRTEMPNTGSQTDNFSPPSVSKWYDCRRGCHKDSRVAFQSSVQFKIHVWLFGLLTDREHGEWERAVAFNKGPRPELKLNWSFTCFYVVSEDTIFEHSSSQQYGTRLLERKSVVKAISHSEAQTKFISQSASNTWSIIFNVGE